MIVISGTGITGLFEKIKSESNWATENLVNIINFGLKVDILEIN